jgi:hypothetical protein
LYAFSITFKLKPTMSSGSFRRPFTTIPIEAVVALGRGNPRGSARPDGLYLDRDGRQHRHQAGLPPGTTTLNKRPRVTTTADTELDELDDLVNTEDELSDVEDLAATLWDDIELRSVDGSQESGMSLASEHSADTRRRIGIQLAQLDRQFSPIGPLPEVNGGPGPSHHTPRPVRCVAGPHVPDHIHPLTRGEFDSWEGLVPYQHLPLGWAWHDPEAASASAATPFIPEGLFDEPGVRGTRRWFVTRMGVEEPWFNACLDVSFSGKIIPFPS